MCAQQGDRGIKVDRGALTHTAFAAGASAAAAAACTVLVVCTYESRIRARCGRCGSLSVRGTEGLRDSAAGDLIFGKREKLYQ